MRDQRATATCWTIVPIFIGTRRRKWSHCLRPQVVFFHLMNVTDHAGGDEEHQPPVAGDDLGHEHRDLRQLRQFAAELLEDALEHGHEEGDERHHHADREDDATRAG